MKKLIYMCMLFAGATLTSCEKDEIGNTATEALAGEWYVTVDGVDANGKVIEKDPYHLGKNVIITYNTNENVATEMYVDDRNTFTNHSYKARVKADVAGMTFGNSAAVSNESGKKKHDNVTIEGGKIMPGAATTPHNTKVDSIVFYLALDNDAEAAGKGFAKYKVSGHRYTGLVEDD